MQTLMLTQMASAPNQVGNYSFLTSIHKDSTRHSLASWVMLQQMTIKAAFHVGL